jgi:hypothetical protein
MPLCLYKASGRKTLEESAIFQKEFRSSAAAVDKFQGTEVSVLAPCRDGEVPSEPSPSVSITVSTVSIDLTAISINLVVSYDGGGSSSSPGLRALPVAMWFTSLSHDVIFM